MGVCAVFLGCCYILFQTWSLLKPPQIRATGHAACNLMANVGRVLAPLLVSNSERTVKVVDSEAQAFFFLGGRSWREHMIQESQRVDLGEFDN